jgi:type VI secretion system protein ImpE
MSNRIDQLKRLPMNAKDLYQAGKLQLAIAAALEDVKHDASNVGKRVFLCELLCAAGDLDRADRQLDAVGEQEPDVMLAVSEFRQLLRAELARQQFFSHGTFPNFLDQDITPNLAQHLEAAMLVREEKSAAAGAVLTRAEEQRPVVSGNCNGQPFDLFRDLDDLTASFFEVFTNTGKYYWIPFERIESLKFQPSSRLGDLLWRRARMIVRDGADGDVYLPALYAGSAAESDDQVRLGRATEWRGEPPLPVRGFGQRLFLVGSEDLPILELKTLAFDLPKPG